MNKSFWMLALFSLLIMALLIAPAINKNADQGLKEAGGEDRAGEPLMRKIAAAQQVISVHAEPSTMAEQMVVTQGEGGGFKLSFPADSNVNRLALVQAGDSFVQYLSYADPSNGEGEGKTMRYEALVVDPEDRNWRSIPLYEAKGDEYNWSLPFRAIDGNVILFVRQSWDGAVSRYDLAELDVEAGTVRTITPKFWDQYQNPEGYLDDFLLADWQSADGGRLLLSSFKGKTWLYDKLSDSSTVRSSAQMFPAYGDIGSKPLRSLSFPSPDLSRMVYQLVSGSQIEPSRHFQVVDIEKNVVLKQISLEENVVAGDASVVWNRGGTAFFLEYANRDEPLGDSFESGQSVSAQGIGLYDRNGKELRELTVRKGSQERMNVFGWVSDEELLVEHYMPAKQGEYSWRKADAVYKLHHLNSGHATVLRKAEDATELKDPLLIKRHEGMTSGLSGFVLLDKASQKVWETGTEGDVWEDEGDTYFQPHPYGEETSILFRWNGEVAGLEWVADTRRHIIAAIGGGWIASWVENNGLSFRPTCSDSFLGRNGAPSLSAAFSEELASGEWWQSSEGSLATTLYGAGEKRGEGVGRFGSIELVAKTGERYLKVGAERHYYGAYEAVFVGSGGKRHLLSELEELSLTLESNMAPLSVYRMGERDLVLLDTDQYRFNRGFRSGVRQIFAYAIAKNGEAWPIDFQYDLLQRQTASPHITIVGASPTLTTDGRLLTEAVLGAGRYELEWEFIPDRRVLRLFKVRDRSEEHIALNEITGKLSSILEQGLGLEDIALPEGRMDEELLREFFGDKAWGNPGFQHLRNDFSAQKKAGTPSRSFAWNPVDSKFDERGNISVTFTINLFYAVGHAAHLEAYLKPVNGVWRIHDFGTLETEKLGGLPGYDGFKLEDPLELD